MGRREDIRDAALAIVDESGARALTLSALFERAHTGAGTFYHYFKDRDDLLNEVFLHCCDVESDALRADDEEPSSARRRFDDLCKRMFEAYVDHPRELNFLYWYSAEFSEILANSCPVIPSVLLLTDLIAAMQQEGQVKREADPSVMAHVVRGMLANVYWGFQHGLYTMDDAAAARFAESALRALEDS